MSQPQGGTEARIRATFERVVADGLRRDSVVGASDAEIDRMAADQGARMVPTAVRSVLRLIGVRTGLWFAGTHFGVDMITGETKRHALATLNGLNHEIRDLDGILVLSAHQAYTYELIDGADLHRDDPPVWWVTEHEAAVKDWSSTSDWFESTAPDIHEYREMLDVMHEMGRQAPGWARDIEPGRHR